MRLRGAVTYAAKSKSIDPGGRVTKAACVIGATGGIGSAVVRALRHAGWSPVLELDLNGPIVIDVTDESSVARAFAQAQSQATSIGLLVVASGILDLEKLSTLS